MVHRSGEVDSRASVDLFVHDGQRRKYEEYREAWHLLRKASGCEEAAEAPMSEPEETPMGPGMARMQAAMNSFRNYLEKGGRAPR